MSTFNSINRVTILGRLGRDPELRYSTNNNPITKFSVATSERLKSASGNFDEKTEWHRIVVFGAQAESCSKFLKKGSLVLLEGRLQTREYQDKEGATKSTTEIIASTVHFLDVRDSAGSGDHSSGAPAPAKEERVYQKSAAGKETEEFNKALSNAMPQDADDDLPF